PVRARRAGTSGDGMRRGGSPGDVPGARTRVGDASTREERLDAPGAPSALAGAPLPYAPPFEAPEPAAAEPEPAPEGPPRRRGAMIAAIVVVLLLIAGIATALAVGGGARGGAAAAPRITSFPAAPTSPIPLPLSSATAPPRLP